ncbi:hypothetical protein [Nocardioides sp.]|uniref:hypothetical protein n=1 Tax=Nocardioides sp. TaxID=35761 RepID=UPI002B273A57|nr:hypothetical protein [Nocardioides sp.]
MPNHQRILVVSTDAADTELRRLTSELRRHPVVLTAPTAEAKRVVGALAVEPLVEVLLAPTRFPPADRSHQLDSLVRGHALRDRFRDVVVVTDTASSTLLLRALAPDQLATGGAVTVVGLPRADRPVSVGRAVVVGLGLGLAAGVVESVVPLLLLPVVTALLGLGLLLAPPWRHLGREALLAAAISVVAALAVISGSARFPGGW